MKIFDGVEIQQTVTPNIGLLLSVLGVVGKVTKAASEARDDRLGRTRTVTTSPVEDVLKQSGMVVPAVQEAMAKLLGGDAEAQRLAESLLTSPDLATLLQQANLGVDLGGQQPQSPFAAPPGPATGPAAAGPQPHGATIPPCGRDTSPPPAAGMHVPSAHRPHVDPVVAHAGPIFVPPHVATAASYSPMIPPELLRTMSGGARPTASRTSSPTWRAASPASPPERGPTAAPFRPTVRRIPAEELAQRPSGGFRPELTLDALDRGAPTQDAAVKADRAPPKDTAAPAPESASKPKASAPPAAPAAQEATSPSSSPSPKRAQTHASEAPPAGTSAREGMVIWVRSREELDHLVRFFGELATREDLSDEALDKRMTNLEAKMGALGKRVSELAESVEALRDSGRPESPATPSVVGKTSSPRPRADEEPAEVREHAALDSEAEELVDDRDDVDGSEVEGEDEDHAPTGVDEAEEVATRDLSTTHVQVDDAASHDDAGTNIQLTAAMPEVSADPLQPGEDRSYSEERIEARGIEQVSDVEDAPSPPVASDTRTKGNADREAAETPDLPAEDGASPASLEDDAPTVEVEKQSEDKDIVEAGEEPEQDSLAADENAEDAAQHDVEDAAPDEPPMHEGPRRVPGGVVLCKPDPEDVANRIFGFQVDEGMMRKLAESHRAGKLEEHQGAVSDEVERVAEAIPDVW